MIKNYYNSFSTFLDYTEVFVTSRALESEVNTLRPPVEEVPQLVLPRRNKGLNIIFPFFSDRKRFLK